MYVVQRHFRLVRRGYDPAEVDRHLQIVSDWFRLSLEALFLECPLPLLLLLRDLALASLQALLALAALLDRAALAEPVADDLEVAVDFGRVITAPHEAKVPLHHVHRPCFTFPADSHHYAFAGTRQTPVASKILAFAQGLGGLPLPRTCPDSCPRCCCGQ